MIKFGDQVIVITEGFYKDVIGIAIDTYMGDNPHPDCDRREMKYKLRLCPPDFKGVERWFNETELKPHESIYTVHPSGLKF